MIKKPQLKLGQKILSSTTGSTDNHLVQLYFTTIADVVTRNGETQIVLGEGLWGDCPRRPLECVITSKKDIKRYFDASVASSLEFFKGRGGYGDLLEKLKARKGILHVHGFNNPKNICVSYLDFAGKTESLKEGNFKEYKAPSGYGYLKVNEGTNPENVFRNLEDAFKYFEKKVIELLK
jgi:hypothetical protein